MALPLAPAPLPEGIALLPFSKATAEASRELMRRAYVEGLGDGGISFEGWWSWLTSDAEYDTALMFVAAADGAVVGFCHCWREAFVKDLVVDAPWRRRGLGSALLTLGLNAFAARGAGFVDLKTDVDNEDAQSLYRRLGFVVVERLT